MKKYKHKKKLKNEVIPVKYIFNGGRKCFVVTEDIYFTLSDGTDYKVEKGFKLDGASVPRFLWWYIPRIDDRILAVILHDHMYVNDYLVDSLGNYKARLYIDREMLIWCDSALPDEGLKNLTMYYAVRLFGNIVFKR